MHLFFIDMDGVIRPNKKPNDYLPDQECLANLLSVVDAINGKVVITSNWKLAFSEAKFMEIFGNHRFIACTPDINENEPYFRYKEIKKYLSEHESEITNYTIVDDRPDLFPKDTTNLHLCDGTVGFTKKDAANLLAKISLSLTQNVTKQETAMSTTTPDLDDKVTVSFQMTRRQLNRLTHVMATDSYQLSAERACFDKIAKFETAIPSLDHNPYQRDNELEED